MSFLIQREAEVFGEKTIVLMLVKKQFNRITNFVSLSLLQKKTIMNTTFV